MKRKKLPPIYPVDISSVPSKLKTLKIVLCISLYIVLCFYPFILFVHDKFIHVRTCTLEPNFYIVYSEHSHISWEENKGEREEGEEEDKNHAVDEQVLARLWRKGNPSALLVGMQTGAATVESSVEFPQKTKNGIAFWSQQFHYWDFTLRILKQQFKRTYAPQCS